MLNMWTPAVTGSFGCEHDTNLEVPGRSNSQLKDFLKNFLIRLACGHAFHCIDFSPSVTYISLSSLLISFLILMCFSFYLYIFFISLLKFFIYLSMSFSYYPFLTYLSYLLQNFYLLAMRSLGLGKGSGNRVFCSSVWR